MLKTRFCGCTNTVVLSYPVKGQKAPNVCLLAFGLDFICDVMYVLLGLFDKLSHQRSLRTALKCQSQKVLCSGYIGMHEV